MPSHVTSSTHPSADSTRAQQQAQKLDERMAVLNQLAASAPEEARREFRARLELSWIHHDSALEGIVYQIPELTAAIAGQAPPDSSSVQTFDEIRQNKSAIDLVREMATRKRLKIDLDVLKDLYVCLAPEEVEGKKPPQYRKDMPLHRQYFHEIAAPDKIQYKLRQFVQWVNAPETKRSTHPVRLAAKAHYQLLHIYPFPKHSGKVARLVMNLILISSGYLPAIIHYKERQLYYDALKASDNALAALVRDALLASIESAIRYFEQAVPPAVAPLPVPTRKAATPKKAAGGARRR